jgi:alpha-N-arabinofuranosidase
VTLKTSDVQATADTRFVISAANPGSVWFSFVSLFPPTYKDRANGNRPDIMQLLADMTPAFLRFPGGNYVEGGSFENRFAWKNTVGSLENRPGHLAPWTYRSSDGLGLLEFLEWCEDLKMEPLLAVYDGLHLDGGRTVITGDALKPFVQEALDEIEYVTGDASTPFGAARAKDGHPEPFKLHYVEIGNEDNLNNGAANYDGRFTMFYDAIKTKYPDLQLISTVPSSQRNAAPRGGRGTPATVPSLYTRTRRPDLIDDHYYMSIAATLDNVHHYDNYDRSAPKIFVGEWATRAGDPTPTLGAAIADAAWLTGLERNADVIMMNCYAPLFVNVNPGAQQWATDLIGYDTLNSFGSPSYYAQKMFSNNRGDEVLPAKIDNVPMLQPNQLPTPPAAGRRGGGGRGGAAAAPVEGFFATASRQDSTGDIILKVVNMQSTPQTVNFDLQGAATVTAKAVGDVLTGDPMDVNSIASPKKVAPQETAITDAAPKFSHEFPAYSVSVIRLKTK